MPESVWQFDQTANSTDTVCDFRNGVAEIAHEECGMSESFLLYQTQSSNTKISLRLMDGTVWLTQKQLADLFQASVQTVNGHLKNIYADGELLADRTILKFRIVAQETARNMERLTDHYAQAIEQPVKAIAKKCNSVKTVAVEKKSKKGRHE
ncbi:MAG: hypothetical protein ACYCZJ_06855 [Sulfuriferula sp.]